MSEFKISINGVIINRLTPDLDHEFFKSRREIENKYVNDISEHFKESSIAKIELGKSDVHGFELLNSMGLSLHGEHIDFPRDMNIHKISKNLPIKIRRSKLIEDRGDSSTIKLHLAGAIKEDLSLRAEGNSLFVGINNRENKIILSHLVDVENTSAKFANDVLNLEVPQPLV